MKDRNLSYLAVVCVEADWSCIYIHDMMNWKNWRFPLSVVRLPCLSEYQMPKLELVRLSSLIFDLHANVCQQRQLYKQMREKESRTGYKSYVIVMCLSREASFLFLFRYLYPKSAVVGRMNYNMGTVVYFRRRYSLPQFINP